MRVHYLVIQAIPPCDPDSQDDELDTIPLRYTHRNKKTNQSFFPRDIHTHKMLENDETRTVNISVLDFKGAMSVE